MLICKMVVGARIATCLLSATMDDAIKAATIVFPEPTSPCNNLNIGVSHEISLNISSYAFS